MKWQMSILATTIILHNSLDKASRDFMATIPTGTDIQIVDWYKDTDARYRYTGPPPSAFPTVIMTMPDGKLGTLRLPQTWGEASQALANPINKAETITSDGDYIGGVTLSEANALPRVNPGDFVLIQAVEQTKATIAATKAKVKVTTTPPVP